MYNIVLTTTPISMDNAAHCGFPCAVKHADSVCVRERDNALTEKERISPTKIDNSSPFKLRKMIFAAGSAKRYNPTALGKATATVTNTEKNIRFLGEALSPLADAFATAGTLAAAMP